MPGPTKATDVGWVLAGVTAAAGAAVGPPTFALGGLALVIVGLLLAEPAMALAAAALAVPLGSRAALPLGGGALTPAPVLLAVCLAGLGLRGLLRQTRRSTAGPWGADATHDSVRHGPAWSGPVWSGLVRHDPRRGGTVRRGPVWHDPLGQHALSPPTAVPWPRLDWPTGAVLLSAVVFVGVEVLAAGRAPSVPAAFLETARWGEMLLAFVLARSVSRSPWQRSLLLGALLVAGVAAAGLGARMALLRIGPPAFAILGGRLYRAFGTFGQPNPFGAYMNMVWPLGAALLGAGLFFGPFVAFPGPNRRPQPEPRRPQPEPRRPAPEPSRPGLLADPTVRSARRRRWSGALGWSLSGGAAAGICGAGLLLSWSRGAWLAAAVAGGTLVLLLLGRMVLPPWSARKVAWGATAMLVGLVALNVAPAGLLPASVEGRLGSVATTFAVWNVADAEITDANYATIERVAHWQAAAAMWRDRPWLGQGPGSYALLYDKYRLPRWSDPLGHAHNYYLMLLAESGLIGLAAYLLFFSSAYWLALSRWLSPRSRLDWALGVGTAGVLAALAFHSLVDDLYVHDLTIHVGLLLGLCAGGPRPSRDPR